MDAKAGMVDEFTFLPFVSVIDSAHRNGCPSRTPDIDRRFIPTNIGPRLFAGEARNSPGMMATNSAYSVSPRQLRGNTAHPMRAAA
jgi:hypothetical protein